MKKPSATTTPPAARERFHVRAPVPSMGLLRDDIVTYNPADPTEGFTCHRAVAPDSAALMLALLDYALLREPRPDDFHGAAPRRVSFRVLFSTPALGVVSGDVLSYASDDADEPFILSHRLDVTAGAVLTAFRGGLFSGPVPSSLVSAAMPRGRRQAARRAVAPRGRPALTLVR